MQVNLKNDIKPISYVKTHAADMMKYINDSHNPIVITQNGEARAVLVDIDSYQEIKNAFALLSIIKLSEDDLQNERVQDADQVFTELGNKYFLNDETV
jgi:prevent-host-death family protein